jgi:hypothetical protein
LVDDFSLYFSDRGFNTNGILIKFTPLFLIEKIIRLKIINLSLEQLEDLGEALLDFTDIAELDRWLITKAITL